MNEYMRPKDVYEMFNVSSRTLLNWCYEGKLNSTRTPGGHRRFLRTDVLALLEQPGIKPEQKSSRRKICYCRVSTSSQKEDLDRQIEFFKHEYPEHDIIRDIGSGINFKRKGFNAILECAIEGNVEEIVVTHKDRLCRFGFELIEKIVSKYSNGKIVVLDHTETSPNEELVNDLISIVTVFSSRIYGLRSHALKNQIKTFENFKDTNKTDQGRRRKVLIDV